MAALVAGYGGETDSRASLSYLSSRYLRRKYAMMENTNGINSVLQCAINSLSSR